MSTAPTPFQIDHYRTFGFIIMRGLLTPAETAALSREADAELAAQYPDTPFDGTRRHFCCMNDEQRTPTFAGLLQDPRFLDFGETLHGSDLIPMWCDANRYSHSTHWHPDAQDAPRSPERAGVKYAIYLEPLAADSGALRVIPGSHRQPLHHAVRDILAQHPDMPAEDVPATACATTPGDVIAFNHALFHAACHARGARRLCTLAYYAQTNHEADRLAIIDEVGRNLKGSRDGFGWKGEVFPAAWIDRAAHDPRRRLVVERMHAAGLIAASGGDVERAVAALATPQPSMAAQPGGRANAPRAGISQTSA